MLLCSLQPACCVKEIQQGLLMITPEFWLLYFVFDFHNKNKTPDCVRGLQAVKLSYLILPSRLAQLHHQQQVHRLELCWPR